MPSDKTKIVCASQAEESGCEIYLGCKVKFVNLTKDIAFNDTDDEDFTLYRKIFEQNLIREGFEIESVDKSVRNHLLFNLILFN